jgi:hypothetical protein
MKLPNFYIWTAATVIGLIFILCSGVLSQGDSRPTWAIFLIGSIFVVAGLIGLKFEDKAYAARHADEDGESKTSGDFWPGLFDSVRELFLGPKK